MSHWIGWKEITEKTKMSREKIVLYSRQYDLPLSRHGRSPLLVEKLFKEWLVSYCSSHQFEAAPKNRVK